jgi:hypothetical protein
MFRVDAGKRNVAFSYMPKCDGNYTLSCSPSPPTLPQSFNFSQSNVTVAGFSPNTTYYCCVCVAAKSNCLGKSSASLSFMTKPDFNESSDNSAVVAGVIVFYLIGAIAIFVILTSTMLALMRHERYNDSLIRATPSAPVSPIQGSSAFTNTVAEESGLDNTTNRDSEASYEDCVPPLSNRAPLTTTSALGDNPGLTSEGEEHSSIMALLLGPLISDNTTTVIPNYTAHELLEQELECPSHETAPVEEDTAIPVAYKKRRNTQPGDYVPVYDGQETIVSPVSAFHHQSLPEYLQLSQPYLEITPGEQTAPLTTPSAVGGKLGLTAKEEE